MQKIIKGKILNDYNRLEVDRDINIKDIKLRLKS